MTFYVEQHNHVMPHNALHGRTPAEVYKGTATDIAQQLSAARAAARQARISVNRASSCNACPVKATAPPVTRNDKPA